MGLLSGTVAVTRFNVVVPPEGPDFERARFWEIEPGSEVRERMGFVPFELDAPYEVAQGRYVFRVRVDRIRPDATAVKERLRELIKTEMEATRQDLRRAPRPARSCASWPRPSPRCARRRARGSSRPASTAPSSTWRARPRPGWARFSPCCARPASRGTSRPRGSTRPRRRTSAATSSSPRSRGSRCSAAGSSAPCSRSRT